MLITGQVIYEVWGSSLQEPVVRQAALTLEKCLLRAAAWEISRERFRERKNLSQTEEAKGKQKLSGGVSILGHGVSCGETMEKRSISELWCKGWGEELCLVPELQ